VSNNWLGSNFYALLCKDFVFSEILLRSYFRERFVLYLTWACVPSNAQYKDSTSRHDVIPLTPAKWSGSYETY